MTRSERDAEIAQRYQTGWKMARLTAKWGLTYRQIYRILHRLQVPLRGWQ